MPTTTKSHLEKHNNTWRVVVRVPDAVREYIGKAHLKQSLNTSNLATANLLKPEVIARFKLQIEEAMRVIQKGPEFDEARAIRAANNRALNQNVPFARLDRSDDDSLLVLTPGPTTPGAKPFERVTSANGATPLKKHMDEFAADQGYQPKSVLELERTLRRLGRNGHWQVLEVVTPEIGTAFMRHYVHGLGMSRKTAGKYLSFLRSYWRWLAEHHHLPRGSDPWSAPLPKSKSPSRHADLEPDEGKRPYKAEELRKLLGGRPADPGLLDLIRIAALTGMRIEEIYRLRVRDVVGGFFLVRVGKTANAARKVPVHADLEGTVERLTEGRGPASYLLDPQAPVIEKTGLRSGAASKAFGYYRKSLGVDERPNGKLKSNVDFHSLRRWFIMSARDALLRGATGYNQWTIADVVGHEDGLTDTLKMTLGLYAGASGDEALRACVTAVQLPR
jgi:integrase